MHIGNFKMIGRLRAQPHPVASRRMTGINPGRSDSWNAAIKHGAVPPIPGN